MSYQNCEAIIIKRRRFSETSLIVYLFTREFGRIEALAKGARREKSPMRGHLDLLNHVHATLFLKDRNGLDLVTESAIIDEHMSAKINPAIFSGIELVFDLINATLMVRDSHPSLFDIVSFLIKDLCDSGNPGDKLCCLLVNVIKETGFAPKLDACCGCSGSYDDTQPVYLSGLTGGFTCPSCTKGKGTSLSPKSMKALAYYSHKWKPGMLFQELSSKDSMDLLETLTRYSQDIIGKELKSCRVLKRLMV